VNPRIAIIGGGLSGLAVAAQLHLELPDADLTLFEAGDRLGGVIYTERVGEFLVDHGADMFSTNPPAAIELCRRLGVEQRLIEPQLEGRGARIACGTELVPLPEGFVLMRATQLWPMLTTPLLSIRGKLRFLLERFMPSIGGTRTRGAEKGTAEEGGDDSLPPDESVADFVRRRMGQEVLERIVAPLSAGIYTADVNRLSMQATMGPIAKMERDYGSLARATAARRRSGQDSVERSSAGARYSQFRAFRGGMIELISTLADSLAAGTIQLSSPVESIDRSETSRSPAPWTFTVNGEPHTFDEVIVAVPPAAASKLVSPHSPDAAKELAKIESASTAIVVLGARESEIERDINTFGFVVPLTEGRRILAGSFASHKFAGRAPQGHVLIRVFVGGAMQPELLRLSDEELVKLVREELSDLIGYRGTPELTRVVRWNHAMPQYHVGHRERVERIEQAMTRVDGLSLMTNALHGVGIAPVIRQAGKLAKTIAARWQQSSHTPSGKRA
jgi:oxygen-dependent protoporphyrinogen oxidase